MRHHVIFVPGLGDHRSYGQDKAIRAWRVFGVQGHYHAVGWADGETFTPKLNRLLAQIDELAEQGHIVSLMGASAGASAVLNAFAARKDKISGVALICGKVYRPEIMHPSTFQHNPAFKGSMDLLATTLPTLQSVQRSHILSLHPLADMTVPPKDTIIPGTREKTMFITGHAMGIAYGLTVSAYTITHFLKRTARI